jgi:hypothetical protein
MMSPGAASSSAARANGDETVVFRESLFGEWIVLGVSSVTSAPFSWA